MKRSEFGIDREASLGKEECFGKGYWVNPETELCEDINECETNQHTCREVEVCENLDGSYRCNQASEAVCKTGFKKVGDECKDIDECVDGLHTCDLLHECKNYEGGFWCIESDNNKNWNKNLIQPINYNKTLRDTSNTDSSNPPTNTPITVKCRSGYEHNKKFNKCEDVDECAVNTTCSDAFKCINTKGSFECVPIVCPGGTKLNSTNHCSPIICKSGFALNTTFNECMDIDECQTGEHKCTFSEKCKNNEGDFECICKPGYKKGENGQCIDKDECSENSDLCRPQSSVCKNLDGSYECECKPGFEKDKDNDNCTDINECQIDNHNCTFIEKCENTEGGFVCKQNPQESERLISDFDIKSNSCSDGFEFNELSQECEDIDECQNKDICDEGSVCKNKNGTFICIKPQCDSESCTSNKTCATGTRVNEFNNCEDIDECQEKVHNCSSLEKCVNLEASFKCECIKGYKRHDNKGCVDENECKDTMICDFSELCKNLIGSYECNCLPGFRKNITGECEDIDECLEKTSNCEQYCFNTYGAFKCGCWPGFKLNDNFKCVDINECEDKDICPNATCTNTNGSYECKCAEGFKMTKIGCIERNKKCSSKCSENDGCECSKNYEVDKEGRFQDIDECENNPCENENDICINLFGSHKCFNFNCEKSFIKLDKER